LVQVQVGPPTETVIVFKTVYCGFFIPYWATYWQQINLF